MTDLINHNIIQIETVFQLLGDKENDITRAIAWTMKKCPSFLNLFINTIIGESVVAKDWTIYYQQYEKSDSEIGYTDLEITDKQNVHIILEAKRGWLLPGATQLTKYAHRQSFIDSNAKTKVIVTLSECTQTYAKCYLPFAETDNGISIKHFSWKELQELANRSRGAANHEQKHLLAEFIQYIGGLMTMQNKLSNEVYVVSIGAGMIGNSNIKWTDIIKDGHYFCPIGINGWPKDPPNYIAFRHDGKLQSIHHIDGYTVTKNVHDVLKYMPNEEWNDNHFVFNLGPAIVPNKEIRTGKGIYRNGRVWVAIDLLLTCETITEARNKSKAR